MTFKVYDGSRTLKFEGVHLSHSSSRNRGSGRWIEFDLYRTESGQYVLSRNGVSVIYHTRNCQVVEEYGLHAAPAATLTAESTPCERCIPVIVADNDVIFPEVNRPWAQVCPSVDSVLKSVQLQDPHTGSWYLTRVARNLLEEASQHDAQVDLRYHTQVVS
jgi:hypothetical protein